MRKKGTPNDVYKNLSNSKNLLHSKFTYPKYVKAYKYHGRLLNEKVYFHFNFYGYLVH